MRRLLALAMGLVLTSAAPARAQQAPDRYDMMYGAPVDVSLYDLVWGAATYGNRAIRTKGYVEILTSSGSMGRVYGLRDMGVTVVVVPVSELAGVLDSEATKLMGQQVTLTGIYGQANSQQQSGSQVSGTIQFWKIEGPPEKPSKNVLAAAQLITLESLIENSGRQDGHIVKVVGKFRGRNLYGDLPLRSQRQSGDWVIKDDVYAAWVVGRKPKGDGFDLDAGLKRDTNKWLEVVGRVTSSHGVVYLEAIQVMLTHEPRPNADAKAPPPPPERPKVAPVVVFCFPLEGEEEVPRSSRFFVQFNKDMEESSFQGHVVLRYAGPVRPGDRGFDGLRLFYEGGRRALAVDPGDNLLPGRTVEILLLPGIIDVDGLGLARRDGKPAGDVVEVLRFRVGSS
jgi:hypothetical protein